MIPQARGSAPWYCSALKPQALSGRGELQQPSCRCTFSLGLQGAVKLAFPRGGNSNWTFGCSFSVCLWHSLGNLKSPCIGLFIWKADDTSFPVRTLVEIKGRSICEGLGMALWWWSSPLGHMRQHSCWWVWKMEMMWTLLTGGFQASLGWGPRPVLLSPCARIVKRHSQGNCWKIQNSLCGFGLQLYYVFSACFQANLNLL